MQQLSCFPSILQLEKVPPIALSSPEKGAITPPSSPESAVHPLFSSSLYLSAVTGVSENTKTSVYAQNYQTFPVSLLSPPSL